jgi:hypothetical protein
VDRAEYRETIQKIKELEAKERYSDAAAIIESVNWKKVKSTSTLCNMGTIMSKAGRYREGKELLLMAYDHATVGKSIVYELVEVALQEGNLEEAQEYYEEYAEIAPKDSKRYLLQYKIAKARKRSAGELIPILEKLNDREFSEEWSYELALLYHQAGEEDKCVQMCDDIVLYFGNGSYVEKALELKQIHTMLTREQAEKQEALRQRGITRVRPGEEAASGEILHSEMAIPTIMESSNKYNTINLQAELAKSMQQIMEASDSQTVQTTMKNVRKLVKDAQLPIAEDEKLFENIESEKDIDADLNQNFNNFLKEEKEEESLEDDQVEGQMSIEEVLAEWEKTRAAAKEALDQAESRRLESAKQRALVQTENLMEQLADLTQVIPDVSSLVQEEQEEVTPEQSEGLEAEIEEVKGEEVEEVATELIEPEEAEEAEILETEEAEEAEVPEEADLSAATLEIPVDDILKAMDTPEEKEDNIDDLEAELAELMAQEAEKTAAEVMDEFTEESDAEEITEEAGEELAEEAEGEEVEEEMSKISEEPASEEKIPEIAMPDEVKLTEEAEEEAAITKLTEEQKEQFSYFMAVSGMENQICSILEGVRSRKKDLTSNNGNIIITGERHCGKTQLAADLVKVIQRDYPHASAKVGRIKAESLNHKEVNTVIEKIYGGYLIIEGAGDLTESKANELAHEMTKDTGGMLVILEDTSRRIKELILRSGLLAGKFTEKIRIPLFTNDELVEFGKIYARENGYVIDEMAILSLYECIAAIAKANHATTLEEVTDIMDDAMDHAGRGRLFSKKDEEGNIILREKDFDY